MDTLEVKLGDLHTFVELVERSDALPGTGRSDALFVFDTNTIELFGGEVSNCVVLEPGEEHKSWSSIDRILRAALNGGLGRDGLFVGVGGGVVCDMTAFAASVYMRGCEVVLVPTTLLAMVDASVGGKTGIDFAELKNMVGTFHPATNVRICVDVLHSLPEREYVSGLAELIKHAFLVRGSLLSEIESNKAAILERSKGVMGPLVMESIGVKAAVVEDDFKESGRRAFLNLGHTFGHALESVSGFDGWTHGEGVAWGIGKAMAAGLATGDTNPRYAERVIRILREFGYRLDAPGADPQDLYHAMKHDKKKRGGVPRFVLQRDHGDTFIREVPEQIILDVLQSS